MDGVGSDLVKAYVISSLTVNKLPRTASVGADRSVLAASSLKTTLRRMAVTQALQLLWRGADS